MQSKITYFLKFPGGGYPHSPLRSRACGARDSVPEALIRRVIKIKIIVVRKPMRNHTKLLSNGSLYQYI